MNYDIMIFNLKTVLEKVEQLNADIRFFFLIIELKDAKNCVKIKYEDLASILGVCVRSLKNWAKNLNDCNVIKARTKNDELIGMLNPDFFFIGNQSDYAEALAQWQKAG